MRRQVLYGNIEIHISILKRLICIGFQTLKLMEGTKNKRNKNHWQGQDPIFFFSLVFHYLMALVLNILARYRFVKYALTLLTH